MIAEVVEKGEGTVTVRFTAQSAHEAVMMSMAILGKDENVSLSTHSGYRSQAVVTFGQFSAPVIEQLQPKPDTGMAKNP